MENRCAKFARLGSVKIVSETTLIAAGGYDKSEACTAALNEVRLGISNMVWPKGAATFTIFDEPGKDRGKGNGVKPIRQMFVKEMEQLGWTEEVPFPTPPGAEDVPGAKFGAMDVGKVMPGREKHFLVEWETGNISSSHRAVNKIALGVQSGVVDGGVLVVPTKAFARFLTDRIGNLWELVPYFPLWSAVQAASGYLGIIAVEHDDKSDKVDRFLKGTDGLHQI